MEDLVGARATVGINCRFQGEGEVLPETVYLLVDSESTVEEVMRTFLKQNNIFLEQDSLDAFLRSHSLWLHSPGVETSGTWLHHQKRLSAYHIEQEVVFHCSPFCGTNSGGEGYIGV